MQVNRLNVSPFVDRRLLLGSLILMLGCSPEQTSKTPASPNPDLLPLSSRVSHAPNSLSLGRTSYAASEACKECHEEEYSTWHDSYHRTMTQWANPETVLAPFDTTLKSRGRTYELEQRDNEFWVTMLDPELDRLISARGVDQDHIVNLPTRAHKVVMTTGSNIAQTYWVETEDSLQNLPWMYHIEDKKWIPAEDSFLFPPTDQRFFYDWNALCAKCHSVAAKPGLEKEGSYNTQVAELGIACESCHGPGEPHIAFQRSRQDGTGMMEKRDIPTKDPIINPEKMSHDLSSQICAQCHSNYREADFEKWLAEGSNYLPGQDLESQVTMHRFGLKETQTDYADGHWMDGTARTGGDEYLGMIQSPCYTQGELSCLSCHSLHNYASPTDQMIPHSDENESCLKCHESMRKDIGRHTHHEEDSSGSLCINCHMPHTSYALFKGIRSHRIVSPNATESAKSGRPSACNLCHLDQTLAWTANHLKDWYQQPIPDLHPEQKALSSTLLHALRGDAAQRVIAAWNLGWEPATQISKTDWQAPILAQLLDDPYSVVRYVAFRSLKDLPGFQDLEYDFLSDSKSRQEATARVLETWREQGIEAARAENGRLLLNSEGQLDEALLNQLLNERDDRPVVIAE